MFMHLAPVFAPLVALCAALAANPAPAQTVPEGVVRIEVLDGGPTARGTYMAALRLNLSAGWKTYWRAPGDAGIPPTFNWRPSKNLGGLNYVWPRPHVFDQGDLQTIGYKDQLVLPVEISPADPTRPVRLRGTVDIGVCRDVCIPASLTVDHRINREARPNPTIAAALAQRPFDRREGGVKTATCRLTPIEGGMRIEARLTMPSTGGQEVAVIEPGNAQIWASPPKTRRNGNVLTAASDLIHVRNQSYALDRSAVRITVLGRDRAVEIQGCAPG